MATEPVEGKRLVFLVDPDNGTEYGALICLTEASYTAAANVISAASRCGTTKYNGDKDRTFDISGFYVFDPTDPAISAGGVFDMFEADTRFGYLFGPETPVDDEEYFTGINALFSNITIGAPQEGAATFTATVQIGEAPVRHVEGS